MIIKYCLPKIIALQKIRKVKGASKIQLIYALRACKKTSKEKQEKLVKSQRKTVCGSEAVQCPGLLIDRYFFSDSDTGRRQTRRRGFTTLDSKLLLNPTGKKMFTWFALRFAAWHQSFRTFNYIS